MPSMAASPDLLVAGIPAYFQEAQHSVANHRKNAVALHRIHAQCAAITEDTPKGTKLVGEKEFNSAFMACLNRILHIKKGVAQADRCLKFVATYASYVQTQFRAAARKAAGNKPDEPVRGNDDDDDDEEDTPATRFVTILLKHAIKGFPAKNKNVRLRCCQVVALLINGLESLDDDLYQVLLDALLMRIKDKESPVRVQTIVALAKLQSGDEDEDEEPLDGDETMTADSSRNVCRQLVETLRSDPSAEARRAAVFNLPVTPATLPHILERLRDTDSINRRCVYLGSLNTGLAQPGAAELSSEQLDAIVKTGLGEREETVKRACKKLISAWVDKDGGDPWKLVDRFDGLKHAESTMMALKSAFETRPALLDSIVFDDEYWNNLTPNHALLARSVVEYLKPQGHVGEARLEEIMPLVMALAFRMQAMWSALADILSGEASEDDAEDVAVAQASILESLLHLALNSDYGDEIGRRKMFTLIREMISHPSLPTSLIEPCMDVLLKISAGQRDFVRIVVEIVQELADEVDDDDDDEDEEDEEAEVEDLIQGSNAGRRRKQSPDAETEGGKEERKAASDGRQLLIVRAMLERMASNLHENTAIHGLIPQLIAPAVKSKDPLVREQGLFCLGLCCLLDSKLALDTFPLFLDQIQKAEGDIKLRATQIVFDLMLVHGIPYLSSRQAQAVGGGPEAERLAYSQIVAFLLGLLEDEEEGVQAVAAEGMAKLMLSGMVENDEALRSLVLVYMSPDTVSNQELRQCLSYFLPVYCFSSSVNQRKLQRVFVPVLQVLTEVYYEIGGEQEMVTPAQVGAQLIDWTDPSKAVNLSSAQDRCLHLDVCLELLQMLFSVSGDGDRDQLKVIVQLLGKLTLPDAEHTDAARAKTFFLLSAKLKEVAPFEDTSTRNAFAKFELGCAKKWPEHAEAAKAIAAAGVSDGEEGEDAAVDLSSDPDLEKLRAVFEACNLTLAVDEDGVASPEDADKKTSSRRSAGTRTRATPPKTTTAARTRTAAAAAAKPRARSSRATGAAAAKKTSRSVSISSSRASSVAPSEADDDDDDDDDIASTIGDLTADEDDDDDEDELAM